MLEGARRSKNRNENGGLEYGGLGEGGEIWRRKQGGLGGRGMGDGGSQKRVGTWRCGGEIKGRVHLSSAM